MLDQIPLYMVSSPFMVLLGFQVFERRTRVRLYEWAVSIFYAGPRRSLNRRFCVEIAEILLQLG